MSDARRGAVSGGGAEWEIDNTRRIGGLPAACVGRPRVEPAGRGRAVVFDGAGDGLQVDTNPIEGAAAFTVEAVFRADPGGTFEQRFFHIQADDSADRVLLELRQPGGGDWYADTFVQSGDRSCVLSDVKLLHAAGQWHALALACDGVRMFQYVDGAKELESDLVYTPMRAGKTSLGMRINRVHWFKGAIRRVRISRRALPAGELLRSDRIDPIDNRSIG